MTRRQVTNQLLMIRPASFGSNPETAASNAFQQDAEADAIDEIRSTAIQEFDRAVKKIRSAGVMVNVLQDTEDPAKPDAVFPNNWISTHEPATIVTYPMFSPTRRQEIRADVIRELSQRYSVDVVLPLESKVDSGEFLEGTGSLILDRVNRVAYACRSPRTVETTMDEYCRQMDYQKVIFNAVDASGIPIYHTNVMMALTEKQVVICADSIVESDRERVLDQLRRDGREIISISMEQMNAFAGNMLQVHSENHQRIMLMSATALESLDAEQVKRIESESSIVDLSIPTIEKYGGGSVRCMLAEIFLEPKS